MSIDPQQSCHNVFIMAFKFHDVVTMTKTPYGYMRRCLEKIIYNFAPVFVA